MIQDITEWYKTVPGDTRSWYKTSQNHTRKTLCLPSREDTFFQSHNLYKTNPKTNLLQTLPQQYSILELQRTSSRRYCTILISTKKYHYMLLRASCFLLHGGRSFFLWKGIIFVLQVSDHAPAKFAIEPTFLLSLPQLHFSWNSFWTTNPAKL